ncbi:cystathionine beta-lyase [Chitinivorax tropicus]|uniref:cysteine-S-conjugate beta-lyase n=1 Tax=Chitinivorax tropicus TaxID=714531 RepID=A0A840MR35_9PROT|nr:PatB family C-S lyase [Chitinivorax tropicus]MBB5019242.1 cystathionine beta-lyase [Chitinivorax tropicus]
MHFDFDHVIDRRDSDSLKWQRYAQQDIIPMWVADMDFPAAPVIQAALQARVEQGIYGYGLPPAGLITALIDYHKNRHGWLIHPEWLVPLPSLVTGLNLAARAVGEPDGRVVMATPVYPKFLSAPTEAGKTRVTVPLKQVEGRWEWDWPALDTALQGADLLLLCNPHNPVGRVWRRDELAQIHALCAKHGVVVCSDEVHCDLVLADDVQHCSYATLGEQALDQSMILLAPSKTWNLAGLGCAMAVIPNATLRRQYLKAMLGLVPHVNVLGYAAAEAAYQHGEPWRQALIDYLRGNLDAVTQALDGYHGLRLTRCEATYLAWIDCRDAGITSPTAFFESVGVGISDGAEFGSPGFARLNFACPRSVLERALQRIRTGLAARTGQ